VGRGGGKVSWKIHGDKDEIDRRDLFLKDGEEVLPFW